VTTQTPIDPKHQETSPHQKGPHVEVFWQAVTYKTVMVYGSLLLAIAIGIFLVLSPDTTTWILKKLTNAVSSADAENLTIAQTQAKFVNLDGKVQVKKVNSVQWVDADYKVTLDKGDLVQTGNEGVARITFGDGTTYTVKPDTLVTVEENTTGLNTPSSVRVGVTTGSVDVNSPTWSSPDSKAAVHVEDTNTELAQNSRVSVKSDALNNEHEIVVASGTAQMQRGAEKIELTQYEKASFASGGPIQRSTVLAPPNLVAPLNLAPIIAENPKTSPVHFEWNAVQDAVSYTFRVSTTSMFTRMVKEAKVTAASTDVTGLDAGDYFWNVSATDAKKQTSEVSETFKFTVVAQGKSQDMVLEIEPPQVHGRMVEIVGRTEPGAALIINGQPVPNITTDGTFRHFTEPLDPGQHTIVVIGQNRRGGTNKKEVSVVVPK
jgi:hypothetical protein